jgi:hypothetical protein
MEGITAAGALARNRASRSRLLAFSIVILLCIRLSTIARIATTSTTMIAKV